MNDIAPEIAVTELADDAIILDVREDDEWNAGHAPGAVHIPLGEIPERLAEIPETDGPLPVICRSGARSGRASAWLNQNGFDTINITGGSRAWSEAGKTLVSENGAEPEVI